ncbi:AMP-binding protein, partial [Listeria monocytogenes]|uniref:AMP-binding protein n=1 Tax=Listeria monocytogenes TaxID=1639 RepID=UPI002FDC5C33
YTSGTTGKAKGSMMKHSNILATISGIYLHGFEFSENDVHLSYLPLAHVFERVAVHTLTAFNASIGFYQGDILKLTEDLALLSPTIFI